MEKVGANIDQRKGGNDSNEKKNLTSFSWRGFWRGLGFEDDKAQHRGGARISVRPVNEVPQGRENSKCCWDRRWVYVKLKLVAAPINQLLSIVSPKSFG